ncbi:hypothetical protein AGR13a_Cc240003 [Agrobacterium genomosp. 13 str. CFBP 6927]|uniref:Uncharacterized protein n=1 Tax=Agrobacterium genomosp. 13 str. CFBP 6927 TaxID=1183428 RepID=A0ABM9VEB3_9HYPH|nr:hypothetical protein AGR13a_Cc240003 [Agrobacterium genomosp. 13 str. CFBP 6927]
MSSAEALEAAAKDKAAKHMEARDFFMMALS